MFDVAKVGIISIPTASFLAYWIKALGFFYQLLGFHDEPYHFVITVS